MTSPSLPENWRTLLAGYVLNDLDAEEVALVDQWLSQYPEVTAELDALQATWNRIPESLPIEPPPPLVRDRILAAVTPAAPAATTPARRWSWGLVGFGLGWAATALALIVVWQENQRLRLALRQTEAVVASFSQPASRLYTLTGTDVEPQASGRLVIDPNDRTALVTTTDLPTLSSREVYRLWAIADGDPIYCGEFNPQQSQAFNQWALPDLACGDADVQMLITAERSTDPPVPAGDLVMEGQS